MSRPKARAADGAKPHRLLLGTPNQPVQWEYATASDARDRIKLYLSEIENFATRHNRTLLHDILEERRRILNADFPYGADNAKAWTFTDQPSGLTWIIKLWKEK
jgi:hypothetical protein